MYSRGYAYAFKLLVEHCGDGVMTFDLALGQLRHYVTHCDHALDCPEMQNLSLCHPSIADYAKHL